MAKRKISSKSKYFVFFVIMAALLIGVVAYVSKKTIASSPEGCASLLSEEITDEKYAYFEGKEIVAPKIAAVELTQPVLGENTDERWIEVDLSEQKIRAWEGSSLFLESLVSTGMPWTPTPKGEFRVWIKLRATKMEGGSGSNYYYLPNVPYVMFYENSEVPGRKGYSLHGTYWHNNFGNVRSHGCVNLPTPVAKQIFYWMPQKGTRIVIHD